MKSKKKWLIPGIAALALMGLLAGFWAGIDSRYQSALRTEDPRQALVAFEKLGSYRDSRAQVKKLKAQITELDIQEAEAFLAQAQALAAGYDYEGALAVLTGYRGDRTVHPEVDQYAQALKAQQAELAAWEGPALSLGLQTLIADPQRAYQDPLMGDILKADHLTCDEFSQVLARLRQEGYVLVQLGQFYEEDYSPKTIYLPQGKKPLLLTQLGLNYYTSLVDSDGDRVPDQDGRGFAHRLEVTPEGELACAYVDAQGKTQVGAYDLVPILEAFVSEHPDFSYQGARALLAVTGFDGLFGYRTDPDTAAIFGIEHYENQCWGAYRTAQALKKSGYELACHTYANLPCGSASVQNLRQDLALWEQYITPILGELSVFVCPQSQSVAQESLMYVHEAGFQLVLTCGRAEGDLRLLAPSTLDQFPELG